MTAMTHLLYQHYNHEGVLYRQAFCIVPGNPPRLEHHRDPECIGNEDLRASPAMVCACGTRVTRWAMVRWIGMPWPKRLWCWLGTGEWPEPGCGCALMPKAVLWVGPLSWWRTVRKAARMKVTA